MKTRNNIRKIASTYFYECLSTLNLNLVPTCPDSENDLDNEMAKFNYHLSYEVIDPVEAFEICGSPDFYPSETLSFSKCDNAISALIHEANQSIDWHLYHGWNVAFNETVDIVEEFKALAVELKSPPIITIGFSSAPRLSFNIHNRETYSNILIYDEHKGGVCPRKIDDHFYGMEKKLSDNCYIFCMFKPVNEE